MSESSVLEGWRQPGRLPREELEGVGEGDGSRGDGGGLSSESGSVDSSLREGGPVDEEWPGVGGSLVGGSGRRSAAATAALTDSWMREAGASASASA